MLNELDLQHLHRAIEIARSARAHGNHPFGALLVDAQGAVVLEAENRVVTGHDATAHAETNLVRAACQKFDAATLARCTLYSSSEPCPMCAGAIFWAGIGRVAYALSEAGLNAFTGDSPERLLLSCREVLARGGRAVQVEGPALEAEARAVHEGFWG